MEEVTVSRMQAVELAKGIVEARDAELAFLLQIQEIVNSTTNSEEHELVEDGEELEEPSQQLLSVEKLKVSQVSGDVDKAAALNLFVDELGSFVEDTEEMQLSLLEAARLAHLDAIKEHDARFARSLANMSDIAGDFAEDPFTNLSVPPGPFANEVDEYESVLSLLEGASLLIDFAGSRCSGAGMGGYNSAREIIPLKRMKVSVTPLTRLLTTREITPRRFTLDTKQQEKGKMVVQEEDGGRIPSSMISFDNLKLESGLPLIVGSSFENETDMNAGEYSIQDCQICFEASQITSTFITLGGCGHQFCESCVSRHAEARILDGGHMHVTCLRAECPTIISYTQLSFLLSSRLLDVLTRRQIEAAIPVTERTYCPFRDCSVLLIKPTSHMEKPSSSTHPHPTASGCVECEACHRAFCLECAVPWHSDMSCAEFKANLKNLSLLGDEQLLQLAGQKKWQRCEKCGQFVELSHGCFHMTCLCKNEFCYACGESWVGSRKACSCPVWTESRL